MEFKRDFSLTIIDEPFFLAARRNAQFVWCNSRWHFRVLCLLNKGCRFNDQVSRKTLIVQFSKWFRIEGIIFQMRVRLDNENFDNRLTFFEVISTISFWLSSGTADSAKNMKKPQPLRNRMRPKPKSQYLLFAVQYPIVLQATKIYNIQG